MLHFFTTERAPSVTHRAVQDKVFNLIQASIQSEDEDSGMFLFLVILSFYSSVIQGAVS